MMLALINDWLIRWSSFETQVFSLLNSLLQFKYGNDPVNDWKREKSGIKVENEDKKQIMQNGLKAFHELSFMMSLTNHLVEVVKRVSHDDVVIHGIDERGPTHGNSKARKCSYCTFRNLCKKKKPFIPMTRLKKVMSKRKKEKWNEGN